MDAVPAARRRDLALHRRGRGRWLGFPRLDVLHVHRPPGARMMASPAPSRRDVLRGRVIEALAPEAHVSSLVLHVRPENLPGVRTALAEMPGVEIHADSGGKLVVTLETQSEADIVTRMNDMSLLPGVLSAALVFHHFETERIPASRQQQG